MWTGQHCIYWTKFARNWTAQPKSVWFNVNEGHAQRRETVVGVFHVSPSSVTVLDTQIVSYLAKSTWLLCL